MTIQNTGEKADILLGVSSPIAKNASLHTLSIKGSVAKMRPLTEGVPVEPDHSILFEPGGMQLMFADPTSLPKLGEATLRSREAGAIKTDFRVLAPCRQLCPTMP